MTGGRALYIPSDSIKEINWLAATIEVLFSSPSLANILTAFYSASTIPATWSRHQQQQVNHNISALWLLVEKAQEFRKDWHLLITFTNLVSLSFQKWSVVLEDPAMFPHWRVAIWAQELFLLFYTTNVTSCLGCFGSGVMQPADCVAQCGQALSDHTLTKAWTWQKKIESQLHYPGGFIRVLNLQS